MSEVNINLNNLSQKAHDEFTIEHWESEGQQAAYDQLVKAGILKYESEDEA